jgi:hypothetical protein
VLAGSGEYLRAFPLVQVEATLGEWYHGEADLLELLTLMRAQGFRPAAVMTERFHSAWLGAADVDVLFVRASLSRVPRGDFPTSQMPFG